MLMTCSIYIHADQKNLEVMLKFLQKIEDDISLDAAILDVKEKEVCLI